MENIENDGWPEIGEPMTQEESDLLAGCFYYQHLNDHAMAQILSVLSKGNAPEYVKEKTEESLKVGYPSMSESERAEYVEKFYLAAKFAKEMWFKSRKKNT